MTLDLVTYTPEVLEIKCIDDTTFDKYSIKGYDNNGNIIDVLSSDTPSFRLSSQKIFKDFIKLTCQGKSDTKIVESEPLDLSQIKATEQGLIAIKSYDGITLISPCPTKTENPPLYDEYQFFSITDKEKTFIAKDLVFITKIKELTADFYSIEAYDNTDGKHILKNISINSRNMLSKQMDSLLETKSSKDTDLVVCVPFYNHAADFARCIDSLLANRITCNHKLRIPIVLVNDKSTDNCAIKIATWYSNNYPDVIFYSLPENKGTAYSRNCGIQIARKKFNPNYIAFVDNDDYVHPYSYPALLKEAYKNDADMSIMRTYIINKAFETSTVLKIPDGIPQVFNSFKDYIENYYLPTSLHFDSMCCKIVRASLLYEHNFPERDTYPNEENLGWYEDSANTHLITTYCEKFVMAKDALYIWDQRDRNTAEGSVTTRVDRKNPKINAWAEWTYCFIVYPLTFCNKATKDQTDLSLYIILAPAVLTLYNECMDKNDRLKSNNNAITRAALVMKHMLKNYDIDNNPYLHDKYGLFEKLKNVLHCANNATSHVLLELQRTKYLTHKMNKKPNLQDIEV